MGFLLFPRCAQRVWRRSGPWWEWVRISQLPSRRFLDHRLMDDLFGTQSWLADEDPSEGSSLNVIGPLVLHSGEIADVFCLIWLDWNPAHERPSPTVRPLLYRGEGGVSESLASDWLGLRMREWGNLPGEGRVELDFGDNWASFV